MNGLLCTQNGLHLPQFLFAFFNHIGVGVLGHEVIFRINHAQSGLIQLQMNDPAFVVDRPCGSILYGLGHIVYVDIVPEHFAGTAVLGGDGSSSKADVGGIGQTVPNDPGSSDDRADFQLAIVFLPCHNFLSQAILPPMGLVRHDHDIPPLGQGLTAFLKFLHGREDDAVGLTACQQFCQVLTARGVLGCLPQEILAPGKLAVELVVQIIPVSDNNDGRTFQRLLQTVGVEDHGQRFSTALGMPEYAAFPISPGSALSGSNSLFDGKILMISGKNFESVLPIHVETDEVFENIKKPIFLKQALKEGVKLGVLGILIAAICGLPFHISIFPGSDCSGF